MQRIAEDDAAISRVGAEVNAAIVTETDWAGYILPRYLP